MTVSKNLSAVEGSTARKAAMPRDEMARLIDRCWAAAFEDDSRKSGKIIKTLCEQKVGTSIVPFYLVSLHRFRPANSSLRRQLPQDIPLDLHRRQPLYGDEYYCSWSDNDFQVVPVTVDRLGSRVRLCIKNQVIEFHQGIRFSLFYYLMHSTSL